MEGLLGLQNFIFWRKNPPKGLREPSSNDFFWGSTKTSIANALQVDLGSNFDGFGKARGRQKQPFCMGVGPICTFSALRTYVGSISPEPMDLGSVLGAKRGSENGPKGSKIAQMAGREAFFGHPKRSHFQDDNRTPSECAGP